jgi:predicted DNA-binding transcriptional regulator YafY
MLDFPTEIACDDSQKEHLFRWETRNVLEAPMERDLALTFNLADQYLRPVLSKRSLEHLEPQFSKAKELLNTKRVESTKKWLDKVRVIPNAFLVQKPILENDIYDDITRAVLDERRVNVNYQSVRSGEKTKNYDFHPFGLIFRDPVHLLIGVKDEDRSKPIPLRLDRMQSITVYEDRPAQIPRNFDIDRFIQAKLGVSYSDNKELVKLKVSGVPLHIIVDTPLSENQKVDYLPGNTALITVDLRITQDFEQWLYANSIEFLGREDSMLEVLEPEYLRERIKSNIKRLSKIYQ